LSGVDAIIHVASPLPDTATPQEILTVRAADARIIFSNLLKMTLF
jgi:hypothetical protein